MSFSNTPNLRAISRLFRFEAAHQLSYHPGACARLHGHSYKLEVTLFGTVDQRAAGETTGMIVDFGTLKQIVQERIINLVDHALLTTTTPVFDCGAPKMLRFGEPTAENMSQVFGLTLQAAMRDFPNVKGVRVRLWETEDAYATWASDGSWL